MTIDRLKAFLLILATLGPALSLDAVSLENKPPLPWPDTGLSPIQLKKEGVISDGLQFTVTHFENQAVPFFAASLRDWRRSSNLSFRNASVCFQHARNPSIKIGVSLIRTKDWLIDLNEESLTRYIAGVSNSFPNRFEWLNENSRFSPVANSSFLLGQPYKQVHFRIKPEDPTKPVVEIRDLISKHEDWLIVFSIECPQNLALQNLESSLMLMSSFALMEDLD